MHWSYVFHALTHWCRIRPQMVIADTLSSLSSCYNSSDDWIQDVDLWKLRVPSLRMSLSKITKWWGSSLVVSVMAARMTFPITAPCLPRGSISFTVPFVCGGMIWSGILISFKTIQQITSLCMLSVAVYRRHQGAWGTYHHPDRIGVLCKGRHLWGLQTGT